MAVEKDVIKAELVTLYKRASNKETGYLNDNGSADAMAAIIEKAILSADVSTTVTGGSASGGLVSGEGTGKLK